MRTYSRTARLGYERWARVAGRSLATEGAGQQRASAVRHKAGNPDLPADDLFLAETVRRAQRGEEGAFESLASEWGPLVYRFLVVRLAHEGDARDALQETLIAAWQSLPSLKRPESFRSWILTIAIRKASKVVQARPSLVANESELRVVPDAAQLLEVRLALGSLPTKMRDVLLLRHLVGLSEAETAEVLRVRVGTVKSRAARARQHMATYLERGTQSRE
jgi:RNA polymerase sigma factor (sigma-70 family)